MKIFLNIPSRTHNNLLDYIQNHEPPKSLSRQNKVRKFIAQQIFDHALESGDCNHAAFYEWIEESTAEKFNLKKYENTR